MVFTSDNMYYTFFYTGTLGCTQKVFPSIMKQEGEKSSRVISAVRRCSGKKSFVRFLEGSEIYKQYKVSWS